MVGVDGLYAAIASSDAVRRLLSCHTTAKMRDSAFWKSGGEKRSVCRSPIAANQIFFGFFVN